MAKPATPALITQPIEKLRLEDMNPYILGNPSLASSFTGLYALKIGYVINCSSLPNPPKDPGLKIKYTKVTVLPSSIKLMINDTHREIINDLSEMNPSTRVLLYSDSPETTRLYWFRYLMQMLELKISELKEKNVMEYFRKKLIDRNVPVSSLYGDITSIEISKINYNSVQTSPTKTKKYLGSCVNCKSPDTVCKEISVLKSDPKCTPVVESMLPGIDPEKISTKFMTMCNNCCHKEIADTKELTVYDKERERAKKQAMREVRESARAAGIDTIDDHVPAAIPQKTMRLTDFSDEKTGGAYSIPYRPKSNSRVVDYDYDPAQFEAAANSASASNSQNQEMLDTRTLRIMEMSGSVNYELIHMLLAEGASDEQVIDMVLGSG